MFKNKKKTKSPTKVEKDVSSPKQTSVVKSKQQNAINNKSDSTIIDINKLTQSNLSTTNTQGRHKMWSLYTGGR